MKYHHTISNSNFTFFSFDRIPLYGGVLITITDTFIFLFLDKYGKSQVTCTCTCSCFGELPSYHCGTLPKVMLPKMIFKDNF